MKFGERRGGGGGGWRWRRSRGEEEGWWRPATTVLVETSCLSTPFSHNPLQNCRSTCSLFLVNLQTFAPCSFLDCSLVFCRFHTLVPLDNNKIQVYSIIVVAFCPSSVPSISCIYRRGHKQYTGLVVCLFSFLSKPLSRDCAWRQCVLAKLWQRPSLTHLTVCFVKRSQTCFTACWSDISIWAKDSKATTSDAHKPFLIKSGWGGGRQWRSNNKAARCCPECIDTRAKHPSLNDRFGIEHQKRCHCIKASRPFIQ